MLTNANQLMQSVHDLFTDLYVQRYGRGSFIAFEPLGVPISSDMFRLHHDDQQFSPALAVERLSEIANTVLSFEDDTAHHSARTVESTVEFMIGGAAPAGLASAAFGAAKISAKQAFDQTLGGLRTMSRYHPVLAEPVDWYDGRNADNWTRHALNDPKPGSTPARVPRGVWRVVPDDMRGSLEQPLAQAYPAIQTWLRHVNLPPAVNVIGSLLGGLLGAANKNATATGVAVDPVAANLSPLLTALSAASVDAQASRHAPGTTNLDVSFDHCMVGLTRPWFPNGLILQRDWCLPGYDRGAISNGAGMDDRGLMPTVVTGFVAVRNLRLAGAWSDGDRAALQGAASLGPFSLQGRTIDTETATITASGMQIVAWFCDPLPVLPPAIQQPASDPSDAAFDPSAPSTAAADAAN